MAAIKNECPGGGIAVNVSPAEAERGRCADHPVRFGEMEPPDEASS